MEIVLVILKGIFLGLALSFVTGPAMFSLIQASLNNGFRSGMYFAMGIFISDALLIAFTYFGFSSLIDTPRARSIITAVGSVILIIFGTYNFLKKDGTGVKGSKTINPTVKNSFIKYFSKGFVFNIINPGVWFFWLIPVGIATGYHSRNYAIIFLGSMLLTIFSFDLLKSLVAHKLKDVLNSKIIVVINKVIGIILILFGLFLIISLFYKIPIPTNPIIESIDSNY